MAWRYVNPGYSKLIQYINNSSSLTNIIDASKSKTGVAYTNSSDTNRYSFSTIPANSEYWIKANFYCATVLYPKFMEYYSGDAQNGIYLAGNTSSCSIYYYAGNSLYTLLSNAAQALTGIKANAVNTIWIHVKYGAVGEGFIELQINNKQFDRIYPTKALSRGSGDFEYVISGNSSVCFSSVIISDEEISPYEELVRLPVTSTTTDMSACDGGGYIASDTSQTLLQAVDTTALEVEYGSDAKVTSIALVGNPAYEVDEVLTKMTSLTKTGGVTTEHETIQLSHESDSVIVSSFTTASDTTLGDLSNWQFGWKASE